MKRRVKIQQLISIVLLLMFMASIVLSNTTGSMFSAPYESAAATDADSGSDSDNAASDKNDSAGDADSSSDTGDRSAENDDSSDDEGDSSDDDADASDDVDELVSNDTDASDDVDEPAADDADASADSDEPAGDDADSSADEDEPVAGDADASADGDESTSDNTGSAATTADTADEKSVVVSDESSGVSITIPASSMPEGIEKDNIGISVSELTEERTAEILALLDKNSDDLIRILDISLIRTDTAEEIQPTGEVTVSVPNLEGLSNLIEVHRINDDDSVTELVATIENGTSVVFSTEHFTEYAITASPATISTTLQGLLTANNVTSDPLDLVNYITSLTMQQSVDNTWTDIQSGASILNGDNLRITMEWEIDGATFGANRSGEFYYQLPTGFEIPTAQTGIVYVGSSSTRAGTYSISTSGLLTVKYDDTYNTDNAATVNTMTLVGTTSLYEEDDTNTITFRTQGDDVTVVIENTYDFTLSKSAEKQVTGDNSSLSYDNWVKYTVVIDSEWGTKGTITLTDAMTSSGNVTDMTYDLTSFTLDGESLSADQITLSTSGTGFTISDIAKLGAGETHTLTYLVNVGLQTSIAERNSSTNSRTMTLEGGTVDNTVTATSGDVSRTADAEVTYGNRMTKTADYYSESTGAIQWTVNVYADPTAGEDIAGYIIEDVMSIESGSGTIDPDTVSIRYYTDSSHTSANSVSLTAAEIAQYFTISEDGQSFSFQIPEDIHSYGWRIVYRVKTELNEVNRSLQLNTVTLKKPNSDDEEWSVSVRQRGYSVGTGTPTKSLSDEEAISSTLTKLTWNIHVDYDNAYHDYYSITDTYGSPTDSTTGNVYTTAHYSNPIELINDLLANTTIQMKIDDGETQTITLLNAEQYNARITLNLMLWVNRNATALSLNSDGQFTVDGETHNIYTNGYGSAYTDEFQALLDLITSSDEETMKIGQFTLVYYRPLQSGETKQQILSIDTSYTAYLDHSEYAGGSTWTTSNTIRTDVGRASTTHRYQEEGTDISKYVGVQGSSDSTVWTPNSATVSYESLGEDEHGKYLDYLLVLDIGSTTAVPEIVIEDQIPEGLSLHNYNSNTLYTDTSYLAIGAYHNNAIVASASYGWTNTLRQNNIQVELPSNDNDRTLKITLTDVNTPTSSTSSYRQMRPGGNGQIAVQYRLYIDDWDAFSSTYTIADNGNIIKSAVISNSAEWVGHSTSSVDTTIERERSILSKTGAQVTDDSGATTSNVKYAITINEAKVDLQENGDELTLVDTITSTDLHFQLDRDSIKLYEYDPDNPDDYVNHPVDIDEIHFSDSGDQEQTITMTVKDATAYILEYEYRVTSVDGTATEGTLTNTADLNGFTTTSKEVNMQSLNSSVTTNFGELKLYKVDSLNETIYLSGAEFDIEAYDPTTETFTKIDDFTIENANGAAYEYFSTDNVLQGNTLYRIKETQAPNGYSLSTDYEYFIILGNIEDGSTNLVVRSEADSLTMATNTANTVQIDGEDVNASTLNIHMLGPNSSTAIYIKNTKLAALTIYKTDTDGATSLPGATFSLYKDNNGELGDLVQENLITNDNGVIKLVELGLGTYQLVETAAPRGYQLNETAIRFRLTETDTQIISSSGNATASTLAEMPASGDDSGASYQHTLTVTNDVTPSYVLPLTGGVGGINKILYTLLLLYTLFIGYVLISDKAKRRIHENK